MSARALAAILSMGTLAACSAAIPGPEPVRAVSSRPLDTLPADADLRLVERDLLATATDRFGGAALSQALSAPAYVIAKRFAGMAPPPPPDAGPGWTPPTPAALLMKRSNGWAVATGEGWRPAGSEAAAELDRLLADQRFWSEPAVVPPCPDYGASLLLVKTPGRTASVRKSSCTSVSGQAVLAALGA